MGMRKAALQLCKDYISKMTGEFGSPPPYIGLLYVGMADLYYDTNDLSNAKSCMDEGSELCRSISYKWIEEQKALEARIQFALGERNEAIAALEKTIPAEPDSEISKTLVLNIATLVELLLRSGNLDKAKQVGERLNGFMKYSNNKASHETFLPYVRLLVYETCYNEALSLLENVKTVFEAQQKTKEIIKFYVLYAAANNAAGDCEKAGIYFEKAISIAEPQDYCRLFLDDEPIIKSFIEGSIAEGGTFISKLSAMMKQGKDTQPSTLEFGEKISGREGEILDLLANGLSNGDIAARLHISVNTVQWHISHIYSKLGVRSRTQAILKARELKII
jgi:LuxR family maltose regulon positive regulatory protein